MGLFNKTSWKFLGIFAAIVAGSIAIAYMAVFFSSGEREQKAAEKYAKTLRE